jgi:AcrR family transcriptional regulator
VQIEPGSNGRTALVTRDARQGGQVEEMQRRRLLLAYGEVVSDGGLEAAIVGRVCERAGVSRRTFYELFADREACSLAAFDDAIERMAREIAPAYMGKGRWQERVRGALSLLLERLDAEPGIAKLCVLESQRGGPRLLERRRRVLEALAGALDEGRAQTRASSQPPPLTALGIVGGVLSVIHTRLLESASSEAARPLVELTGPLMATIVHPYLGPVAARKELERPAPATPRPVPRYGADLFKGLPIRFTYRTARVLSTIAEEGRQGRYPSNRHIADSSGIADDGQMSRLLRRLQECELIENRGVGHAKGEPNAWVLTQRGQAIQTAIAVHEPAA